MSEDLLVRHTLFSSDCLVGREKAVSEVCWGDDNRRLKGRSGLVGGGTVCCGSVRCGHDRCGPVVRNDFVVDCDFGSCKTVVVGFGSGGVANVLYASVVVESFLKVLNVSVLFQS